MRKGQKPQPYRPHRGIELIDRFNCALCHSRHGAGACSVRIAGFTVYGGR